MATTLVLIGLTANLVGVLILFRFALPYATRNDGQHHLVVGDDADAQKRLRTYQILSGVGIAFVVLGTILQSIPLLYPALPPAASDSPTDSTYRNALPTLAGLGAVLWTGGLIVLQLKSGAAPNPTPDDVRKHDLINVGMALSAYGALVPLLGILSNGNTMRCVALAVAVYYLLVTLQNVRSIADGLASADRSSISIGFGYLAPTIGLFVVAALPLQSVVAWSAALFIFLGYVSLSSMSRSQT